MSTTGSNREAALAQGIAALGRVARDEDGFTVYGAGPAPDAFRVWDDEHAGVRCTCDRFVAAFRSGEDYRCEHVLAVEIWRNAPADEVPAAQDAVVAAEPLRRVV